VAAQLAGVVLAGGRGKRYGGPKAFALLPDGRSFLTVCVELLSAAGANPVVATLPPEAPALAGPGFVGVPLPADGLAMFDSLRLGLERALADPGWTAVVVLPVDHPLITLETVRVLAAAAAPAAIPSFHGKHGHPVALSRTVAEDILAGTLQGPTLREVLRTVGRVDVEVEDPGVTANCNTEEALAAALKTRHD
jgi:CTP:molybdopterin cytidylyltransferase MocA